MKEGKNMTVYEKIIANIIDREVFDLARQMLSKFISKVDIKMEPIKSDHYDYVEFEASFTVDSKSWKVCGLVDDCGRVSLGDLICDGKLIYKFY